MVRVINGAIAPKGSLFRSITYGICSADRPMDTTASPDSQKTPGSLEYLWQIRLGGLTDPGKFLLGP
jgi:hypothetical protein